MTANNFAGKTTLGATATVTITPQAAEALLEAYARCLRAGLFQHNELPAFFNAAETTQQNLQLARQQPPAIEAQAATDQPAQAATKEKANGNP
jgi:hypothetical protein